MSYKLLKLKSTINYIPQKRHHNTANMCKIILNFPTEQITMSKADLHKIMTQL